MQRKCVELLGRQHTSPENSMTSLATPELLLRLRGGLATVAILVAGACSSADKAADTTVAAAPEATTNAAPMGGSAMNSSDSMSGMKKDAGMKGMGGMAMTGDADRDFLRMMSDHHKGMILMARTSWTQSRTPSWTRW